VSPAETAEPIEMPMQTDRQTDRHGACAASCFRTKTRREMFYSSSTDVADKWRKTLKQSDKREELEESFQMT